MLRTTSGFALAACLFGLSSAALAADKPAANAAKAPTAAGAIPIDDFIRKPTYSGIKISPTGEYLAMTVDRGDQDVLTILRTKDLSLVKVNVLPDKQSVGQFYWTSPNRLLFNSVRKFGRFAAPFLTGQWFSVNADGSQPRTLDPKKQSGRILPTGSTFSLLDNPQNADGKVLMQLRSPRGEEMYNNEVVEFDTLNANWKVIARAPRANCEFATDAERQPIFAVCSDYKDDTGKFAELSELYRRGDDGKWTLVNSSRSSGSDLSVVHSSRDGRIYAIERGKASTNTFGTIDPKTGQFKSMFRDPDADPSSLIVSADGKNIVLGVVTEAGKPAVTLFDEDNPDTALYRSLAAGFPGQFVNFSSHTRDGKLAIVRVYSDKNPGELYLYDRAKGQARFLMQERKWIDQKRMAQVKPVSFTTRDGLKVFGFLTIPNGSNGKNLPMIVNVHGGPIGPRDNWEFFWENQLFASRGYAVLQVNFRGSGGYGKPFEEKGYGNWRTGIMDDIIDGTEWAIKQGYADKDRICIYGGSFGGYASMMAPARAPGLFKCAFGYVGMYDAMIQIKKSDTGDAESGRTYMERAMGDDKEELRAMSPITYAKDIKLPVFLAAGARDARCPPEHTEAMFKALAANGNTPEGMIIASGEGHGFYKDENNLKLYTEMLNFFSRHIGGGDAAGNKVAAR
jgi:dipeptidyl aminopeptidase/acylaminoacyl peptidase